MLFRDVLDLVQVTRTSDGGGGFTETETSREVFANRKSIRSAEFYQAQLANLKPEIMFEVRAVEYQEEPKVRYAGKVYQVIRTYTKNGEILELVCSRAVS